ncbi:MAG TPA: DUF2779 domain-containing protein [Acholeplasma sp.]|nr:DUF2779 domain-containing protein [Acholeplasma sp.]
MKISKTKFFNYMRCDRYPALYELTYKGKDALISFSENLDDLFTEELEDRKRDLLENLQESIGFEESDFLDEDFDPLHVEDKLLELMMAQYTKIEELTAEKALNVFGGKIIYSADTYQQKYFETEINGYKFFAFLDAFHENDDQISIIETKASTSNKFLKIGNSVGGVFDSIFAEFDNGVLRLKEEIGADITPKYHQQRKKLLDKYGPAGKYVYDLAYQRYMVESTLKTHKPVKYYLSVLNRDYVYDGTVDKEGKAYYNADDVMVLVDLTEVTRELQLDIEQDLKIITERLDTMQAQPVPLGVYCQKGKGHRECPFIDICLKDKGAPTKNSIFAYRDGHHGFKENRGDKKNEVTYTLFELVNKGITKALDIPRDWLSEKQKIQYDTFYNKKPHAEIEMIRQGLKSLKYPLYHLDFESFASPLPRYKGEKPYQQSLFQFSLHIEYENKMPDINKDHIEFLAQDHTDQREALVKKLIESIPMDDGMVVVYNKGFESARLKELILLFPQYAKELESIRTRIFDLLYLVRGNNDFYQSLGFSKKDSGTLVYYDEKFQRSYSIKKVIPVFAPSINYESLEEVQNGMQAQAAYYKFPYLTKEEFKRTYTNMLKYCQQDTWAMVKILEGLRELVNSQT